MKKNNLDGLFGFVDPGRISQKAGKKEQRSNALALRLQNCKKGQLIFAPYNKGLLVLCVLNFFVPNKSVVDHCVIKNAIIYVLGFIGCWLLLTPMRN